MSVIHESVKNMFEFCFDVYAKAIADGDLEKANKTRAVMTQTFNEAQDSNVRLMEHINKLEGKE